MLSYILKGIPAYMLRHFFFEPNLQNFGNISVMFEHNYSLVRGCFASIIPCRHEWLTPLPPKNQLCFMFLEAVCSAKALPGRCVPPCQRDSVTGVWQPLPKWTTTTMSRSKTQPGQGPDSLPKSKRKSGNTSWVSQLMAGGRIGWVTKEKMEVMWPCMTRTSASAITAICIGMTGSTKW